MRRWLPRVSFLKQKRLEEVIESLGDEIHNQYLICFTPPHSNPEEFHQIRGGAGLKPSPTSSPFD